MYYSQENILIYPLLISNMRLHMCNVCIVFQLAALVSENEVLHQKVQLVESLEREKHELEHQLETNKESLFSEQKKNRAKIESLEEELESHEHQLEEVHSERDVLQRKLTKLENRLKTIEKTKSAIIQVRYSPGLRELRTRVFVPLSV